MRLHVDALYEHDDAGDMIRVNEPNGSAAPRFHLGRTAEGDVLRFRHDVDAALRRELQAAATRDARVNPFSPIDPTPYVELLAPRQPVDRTSAGPAFAFPDEIADSRGVLMTAENAAQLQRLLAPWLPDVTLSAPLFAIVVEGRAVAVCGSVRRTPAAHEAGVETVPEFRHRGFAVEVVSSWARAVRAIGVTPLYSTSWTNTASQAVARKLGLICFGTDLHVT
jgi:RimJ/RimL family protein N-acetyltransferase